MDEGSKEPKFMFILLPVFCQSFILCFVPHYSFMSLSSFHVIDKNIFYHLHYICLLSKDKLYGYLNIFACLLLDRSRFYVDLDLDYPKPI